MQSALDRLPELPRAQDEHEEDGAARRTTLAAHLRSLLTGDMGIEELQEEGWLFICSAPASQRGRGSLGIGIALSPLAAQGLDEKHDDLGPRVRSSRHDC